MNTYYSQPGEYLLSCVMKIAALCVLSRRHRGAGCTSERPLTSTACARDESRPSIAAVLLFQPEVGVPELKFGSFIILCFIF